MSYQRNALICPWKTRSSIVYSLQTGDVIQSQSKATVNRGPRDSGDEMRYLSPVGQGKIKGKFLLPLFALFRYSVDQVLPLTMGRAPYLIGSVSPETHPSQVEAATLQLVKSANNHHILLCHLVSPNFRNLSSTKTEMCPKPASLELSWVLQEFHHQLCTLLREDGSLVLRNIDFRK